MAPKLSRFKASALVTILSDTLDQVSIMQATLIQNNPLAPHFECPGLRLPPRELDVRRVQNFRLLLEEIVTDTVSSLLKHNSFIPLTTAVEKLQKEQRQTKNVFTETEKLPKKLQFLREDLRRTEEDLRDLTDPGRVAVFQELLGEEWKRVQDQCARKLRYFEKFLESKKNSTLEKLKFDEDNIRDRVKTTRRKIEDEKRCSQEMQFFLQMRKTELSGELEQCMQLQDEMMAEKETKMQVLRIRKEHLEEETAKGEVLLTQRSQEMKEFLKIGEEKEREKCAVGVVQAWWRERIAARPKLLMMPPVSKKKRPKKKKRND